MLGLSAPAYVRFYFTVGIAIFSGRIFEALPDQQYRAERYS
jgi:hypothetical protein